MKRLFTSCFGLGWLPLAPGTAGSLPPAIIFAVLCTFKTPPIIVIIIMAVLALAGSVICLKFAPDVIAATGKTDPAEVVIDEFAGQAVTFCAVPFLEIDIFSISQIWTVALLGFLLFRFFDILKPWPIRRLEKLPGGLGILADDLLAGVYAAIPLQVCVTLWIDRCFSC